MRPSILALVLSCFALQSAAVVTGAAGGEAITAQGWVLIEAVGGTNGRAHLIYEYVDRPALGLMFMVRQADGHLYEPFGVATAAPGMMSAGMGGEEAAHVGPVPGIRIGGGGTVQTYALKPNEPVWLALLVGGEVRYWNYSMVNATWKEIARGEVHVFEPRDFAPVGVDARVYGAGAFAGLGARSINVEHELVGAFGRGFTFSNPGGLSVDTPTGTESCGCYFPSLESYGPGEYTFNMAGGGVRALHGPLVVVADIPIPRT